jgi:hypothetical protein
MTKMSVPERIASETERYKASGDSLDTTDGKRTFHVGERVATVTGTTGTIVGFSAVRMLAPGFSRPEPEAIIVWDANGCGRIFIDSLTKV